jgi:dipeptidyl aminopeptidase/acylaminoacyl peptidase
MRGFALAFLGTCIHDDPDSYAAASPLYHLTTNSAPLLMVHGTADECVPLLQPRRMQQAAETLGAPVDALYLDGAGHSPGSPRDPLMIMAWQRITDFYAQHLRLSDAVSSRHVRD